MLLKWIYDSSGIISTKYHSTSLYNDTDAPGACQLGAGLILGANVRKRRRRFAKIVCGEMSVCGGGGLDKSLILQRKEKR